MSSAVGHSEDGEIDVLPDGRFLASVLHGRRRASSGFTNDSRCRMADDVRGHALVGDMGNDGQIVQRERFDDRPVLRREADRSGRCRPARGNEVGRFAEVLAVLGLDRQAQAPLGTRWQNDGERAQIWANVQGAVVNPAEHAPGALGPLLNRLSEGLTNEVGLLRQAGRWR